jgi:hypothetical protein
MVPALLRSRRPPSLVGGVSPVPDPTFNAGDWEVEPRSECTVLRLLLELAEARWSL